jgi:hypothetical protein
MYRYRITHKGRTEVEGTIETMDDMRVVNDAYKDIICRRAAGKWNRMFAPWSNEIAEWMSEWCVVVEKTAPTPVRFKEIITEIRRRPDLCTQVKRAL